MGSQTMPKLPLIDLTQENLKPGTRSWVSTSNDVRHALETYGCFVVAYEKIPLELHNKMFDVVEGLFDVSEDIKGRIAANERAVGYHGPNPLMPLFEGYSLENAATLEGTQKFTHVIWPTGNDVFCETALSMSKQLVELYEVVMRMVFESYGLYDKYYESNTKSTTYRMGFAKYRPPRTGEINVGRTSHTDKCVMNVLDQNLVKGLEVETKDGEWIYFDPAPNHFVVFAGDAFMAWSNGRIYPPYHRVTINGNEAKYTVAFNAYMKDLIETPEELVDDDHPLMFKPFSHLGYLQYCLATAKNNLTPSLKDYCGV